MDPDEISAEGQATLDVFDRLTRWLTVSVTTTEQPAAIPTRDPDIEDAGNAWDDVSFEVPNSPDEAEWMSAMRASFGHQYASDLYQDVGQSAASRSKSQSQSKQGA